MALVGTQFLGFQVGGGVEQRMADRLASVEAELRRIHAEQGAVEDFVTWGGIRQQHGGHRAGGYHAAGIAIDINYDTNPYIATRTGSTYGGEAGFLDAEARRARAVAVYDRAVAFTLSEQDRADVSIRVNDTIEVTYDRFRLASDCLAFYLSHVFTWGDRIWVRRTPIGNAHELPDGHAAFGAIGDDELWAQANAIELLEETMGDAEWLGSHPGWAWTPETQYWQIIRDYEAVRTPMLKGSASQPVIRETRNPANGFMDLRRELVIALVSVGGMSWGASDFGSRASGDMMHFDLGTH